MSDDHSHGHQHGEPAVTAGEGAGRGARRGVSRRSFLGGVGAGAIGIFLPGLGFATTRSASAQVVPSRRMQVLAMHVHSSFSEGTASMYASLREAARTGMDLVYFTDHDWRKRALAYRTVVHFTSLTDEREFGQPWIWRGRSEGGVASQSGGIVASPSSPRDPIPGALRIRVTSQPGSTGWRLYDADDNPSRKNLRANVVGQRLQLEVRMNQLSPDAWMELRLTLSFYPALGGRPAGSRVLIYRFGTRSGDERSGLQGIVWRPIPAGAWTSIELRPLSDITRLWPELPVPGDNATYALKLGAGSRNGAVAEGWFDYLRFFRDRAGSESYAVQDELLAPYRAMFPAVAVRQSDEVSFYHEHVNWITGPPSPFNYGPINQVIPGLIPPSVRTAMRQFIHAQGGLVQLNHPFGADEDAVEPNQAALLRGQAVALLGAAGAGIDLLEVAYRTRGGATLATHVGLLDVLARNGRFVTATGVTDDHEGTVGSWSTRPNRFATAVWAPSLADADLRRALLQGQAWCVEVGSWVAPLDVTVDGNPMGSVSVRPGLATRTAEITCPQPPPGGRVQLVRGVVDFAGTGNPTPNATVVSTISAGELAGGPVRRPVNTSVSCFVRAEVVNASGRVVGLSNPVWLLRSPPPNGIPSARVAPDTPR